MPPSNVTYDQATNKPSHVVKEGEIEYGFIGKLQGLKYEYRSDIRDRAAPRWSVTSARSLRR